MKNKRYISIYMKFIFSHCIASCWLIISILLSFHWIIGLGSLVTIPVAILIICGISYIPGYMNAFMITGLLFDRQPKFKNDNPDEPVTILIACRNEEKSIEMTIQKIAEQDYAGYLKVIVIDNASSDNTGIAAEEAGKKFNIDVSVLRENKPGKHNALNKALQYVETKLVLTLDADTLLHKDAMRYIAARMLSSLPSVCAVAGTVLVRNSRLNMMTKIQEWDYFLGIASIKRLQGLYQSTLVAQGAFSLYKTDVIKEVGGWPDAIGEDIVLTWKLLKEEWKVYFEPLAVAFTDVPVTLQHFVKQRNRWARGMIEALKLVKPWSQPLIYTKYLTGSNLIIPYVDIIYTFCWMPGLILSFFGLFWVVGPATLLVLPLAMIQNYILYSYQRFVFRKLKLKIRKNIKGFIVYVLCYQMLMSPISVYGYFQELFKMKRVWK